MTSWGSVRCKVFNRSALVRSTRRRRVQLCCLCSLEKDKFQPGLDRWDVGGTAAMGAVKASMFMLQPYRLPSSLAKGVDRCWIFCCRTSFLCQCVWRRLSVSRRSFMNATSTFSRRVNRHSRCTQTTSREISFGSSRGERAVTQNGNLLEKFHFNSILSTRTGS